MKLVKAASDSCVNADEVLYLLAPSETHTKIVFRNGETLTVPTPMHELARRFPR